MRVLVLGGGYAGVTVARRLERRLPRDVGLTVIDRSDRHVVQHELHRLVRDPDLAATIAVPFRDLFSRARVVQGEVSTLEDREGVVALDDGRRHRFDLVAVCLGARTAYHDLPGVEEHSTPLKRIADAQAVRDGFHEVVAAGGGRVVVGGAGLSGVQVAGELAALAGARRVDDSVEVVLLEQADVVAPGFPAHFSAAVHRALVEEGVDVRTGTAVVSASDDSVELADGSLAYDQFVWTGGIRGPAPFGDDRPTVPATLRLGERAFVAGDAASVVDRDGAVLPATAQAAVAQAAVAADNIARLVGHARDGGTFEPRLETVEFAPRGWIVSVGDRTVAQVGPMVVRDGAALALKAAVGARYLAGVGAVRQAAGLVGEELLVPSRWAPGPRLG